MQTILVTTSSFSKFDTKPAETLAANGFETQLNPFGRKLTETEFSELLMKHQPVGIIAGVEPITQNSLEKAQNLKVISRAGIGMDAVDLDAAKKLGITVNNTPDAPTIPVAELTIGMILTLLRRIHVSDTLIKQGEWSRPMGNLLHGKTIGIIGCGRIGSYLGNLLKPFGCVLNGYDPAHTTHDLFNMQTLDELFEKSDIISLHIPYSAENHHIINSERLSSMKKDSIIVNASRGGLIDEDALHESLKTNHLAGAALDTFESEPYTGPLKNFENVVLTGHIGSYAKEARTLMEMQAVENLLNSIKQ